VDLFRLRVFVAVVDRNGYSAAARELHLAQSTVSHHVAELERELGSQLLQYKGRTVHLTTAGEDVYQTALVMLTEQDRLVRALGDLEQGRRGRVRLGLSMAFEQRHFLERVIVPFCRSNRGTMLSLRFGHSRREAQAVLDRELDLAYVIRWHLPVEARFEALHQAELAFLAAPDHPLSAEPSVTVEQIGEAGLITAPLTGAESGYYRELLRGRGLSGDHSVLEIDGQQARFFAAATGLGVMATFLPRYGREIDLGGLTVLRVEGTSTQVELGLVRRREAPPSTSVDAVAAWLRQVARS
jgi:DNA-binding transcriptional LysR family regulator